MKKIFYLFAAACLMMSCNDSNQTGKGVEPTGLGVQAEGTAGAKVTVVGKDIASDAKFYLAGQDSNAELEAEILASGAEVTLPYTLGEFTLSVEQGGSSYNVGKIRVAVTGIVLPDNAEIGEKIVITANGFADDAAIFIGSEDAQATFNASGCELVVPATVSAGENAVTVKQKGTEQELGKINVTEAVAKKNLTGFSISMMGDAIVSFSASYDDAGNPVSFDSYSIKADGSKYTFTGDDLSWTFTVENGRVAGLNLAGKDYKWEYDEDGHLVKFHVDDYYPYTIEYDNEGNSVLGIYEKKDLLCEPNHIDLANALAMVMTIEENTAIYYSAVMFGWAGKPSTNLPSHFAMDEETMLEYAYDTDADGFVKNVADEMGLFQITCTY